MTRPARARRGRPRTRTALVALVALAAGVAAGRTASAAFSPADVYREAAPSVVFVFANHRGSGLGSTGTGSVIGADGLVITNRHVVTDDIRKQPYKVIQVYFRPASPTGDHQRDLARPHRARVVASSPDLDLALLRVEDPPAGLRTLPFGDSATISIGDPVAAIGHPTGGGLWTLTTGTISGSRILDGKDVFQTEAALNPGNSGGPLLDAHGHLIGVNTSIVRNAQDGTPLVGLNFAVKSDAARAWLDRNGVRVARAPSAPRVAARISPSQTAPAAEPSPVTEAAPVAPREPQPESEPVVPRRQLPPQGPSASPTPPSEPQPDPFEAAERELLGDEPGSVRPRAFRGPDGERMYGLPDRSFDLDAVRRELYERSRAHAGDAFDELGAETARRAGPGAAAPPVEPGP